MEAAICDGISRFLQEYLGRRPKETRAFLLGDLVVVRMQGVLTAAEQHLVQTFLPEKGRDLLTMALADELTKHRDQILADLDAVHDYYTNTKAA
jgi:uncharacterized protein YbcI